MRWHISWLLAAGLCALPSFTEAQVLPVEQSSQSVRPTPRITPPNRPVSVHANYHIRAVDVETRVRDQVATVQISQVFKNAGSTTLETQFVFPMPEDASISGLTLMVDGKELTGKLMRKDEARRIYEEIVRRRKDPALLEYMGRGLFRTNVFPLPAGAERTVVVRYTQVLKKESGLVDLLLPLGTSKHSNRPVETLNLTVRIDSADPIKSLHSPSHDVKIERPSGTRAVCKLSLQNVHSPDDFRLFYGTDSKSVGLNLISYNPDDKEDGYFLLLASPDVKRPETSALAKTVVCVFDRSGSMSGRKFEQARDALKFVVGRLEPHDTFNIVAYDSEIEAFRPELQKANQESVAAALGFIDGLYAGGGTNIHDALQTSLGMLTDPNRPSYVLFLTDGLPTVGTKSESAIASAARDANKAEARLFSFGVGFDVNSRLLDRLSRDLQGQSVYVRPNEDIEATVSSFYAKIGAPVLTDLKVDFEFDAKPVAGEAGPISRTYPRQLPDLFHGQQLLWVGRYKQAGPVKVTLSGANGEERQTFDFSAELVEKSVGETNGFVEKLWATRRIGEIIDELDLNGQNKELVDELVKLSIKHGIMTPYTSFLADENVSLAERENADRAAVFARRRLHARSGRDAFSLRREKGNMQKATRVPAGRFRFESPADVPMEFRDSAKNRRGGQNDSVQPTMRQIGQKTFFRKKSQWQDSTVTEEQIKQAIRVKQFSKEYFDLAAAHGGKLAKYLAFQEPVVLNLAGKTYAIDP